MQTPRNKWVAAFLQAAVPCVHPDLFVDWLARPALPARPYLLHGVSLGPGLTRALRRCGAGGVDSSEEAGAAGSSAVRDTDPTAGPEVSGGARGERGPAEEAGWMDRDAAHPTVGSKRLSPPPAVEYQRAWRRRA